MICVQNYIYADDSKIYRHVLTNEDQEKLQNNMHRLTDWADEWLLKLNVDKCQCQCQCQSMSIVDLYSA